MMSQAAPFKPSPAPTAANPFAASAMVAAKTEFKPTMTAQTQPFVPKQAAAAQPFTPSGPKMEVAAQPSFMPFTPQ